MEDFFGKVLEHMERVAEKIKTSKQVKKNVH